MQHVSVYSVGERWRRVWSALVSGTCSFGGPGCISVTYSLVESCAHANACTIRALSVMPANILRAMHSTPQLEHHCYGRDDVRPNCFNSHGPKQEDVALGPGLDSCDGQVINWLSKLFDPSVLCHLLSKREYFGNFNCCCLCLMDF